MSQRKRLLTVSIITLMTLMSGCVAKNVVSRVNPAETAAHGRMNGVFYALPRTVAIVSVPIKKTHKEPGEFLRFSRCFFPNEDPIEQKENTFSIGTPTFATRGEPDPSKVFMVKIQGSYLEDKTMQIDLTDGGVMTKGEIETKNQTLDFATKAIKTAISIGAQAAGTGLKSAAAKDGQSLRETLNPRERACYDGYVATLRSKARSLSGEVAAKVKAVADTSRQVEANARDLRFAIQNAQDKVDQGQKDLQSAGDTAASAEQDLNEVLEAAAQEIADPTKRTGRFSNLQLQAIDGFIRARNDVDDFERAKEVFDKIAKLHGQRESLLTTSIQALSVDTLKAMLKELDDTIETLQSKFLGSSKDETPWAPIFEVTLRDNEAHSAHKLLDLSKANGVCMLPAEFAHIVVPPKFQKDDANPCTSLTEVLLRIDKGRGGSLEPQLADTVSGASFSQDGERGFYFRIPAVALVRVETRALRGSTSDVQTVERGRDTLAIAQLGTIVSLPASSNGRTTKYILDLYPETGALKTFNLGSSALIQNSLLEDAAGAATSINDLRTKLADSKAKQSAAAAAKADQLTQLQRTSAILELQVKIKELEEKLKEKTP